ncbi:MAG: hypothetical protein LBP75_11180 [Planctomycetota bacterium]|jgi:hypothetical protein|nr:hypothetical protein [Planctomycetota bacterium]
MTTRKREQGVAVIVAVALAVALVMVATALLGTARRHTDTARAYRQTDMLQMALLSVKADAIYQLNAGDLAAALSEPPLGKNLYDFDGAHGFVAPRDFADPASLISGFRPAAADFYTRDTGNYFDRKMNPTTEEQSIYALKTRAYAVPLASAFLVEMVKKYREIDGDTTRDPIYPFPGLFDGENALAQNMVNVYTDTYAVYPYKRHNWNGTTAIDNAHNEFALDDFILPKNYHLSDSSYGGGGATG